MGSESTTRLQGFGRSPTVWIVVLLAILWLVWTIPLAFEQRTLFLRDVFTTALPLKFFGAEALRQGDIPVFNPLRALGQAHSGNPNALPFYPGNLLYLLLPVWSAFNLHYALHLLLSLVTMTSLCRRLGLSREASLMGGITYAGSGWVLTCLSFYNILTVAAWWPLAMIGAVGGGRRGAALGGFAVGMAVLGGEPVTAAIGFVPLLWLAVDNHGWRKGIVNLTTIAAIGALIALPQLVATLSVFDFTLRGGPGLPASKAGVRAFHPIRLLEFVLPFPFGEPGDFGPREYWQFKALPTIPYFYTLYFGIVGLWLAFKGRLFTGRSKSSGWLWLALAGIGLGWVGGLWPGLFEGVSTGLFRYPEKFLFWLALAVPVLAGLGFDRLIHARRPLRVLSPWFLGGTLLVLAVILFFLGPAIVESSAERAVALATDSNASQLSRTVEGLEAHLDMWLLGLASGGALLVLTGFAVRRRSGAALIALQLVGLFQLYPLMQSMPLDELTKPSPWMAFLSRGAAVHNAYFTDQSWQELPAYEGERFHERTLARLRAAELDSAFGIAAGLSYPLATDLEGIYSPLNAYLLQELERASWQQRVNWLRVLGVEYLLLVEDPGVEGVNLVAAEDRRGVQSLLFEVERPALLAWWPEVIQTVVDPAEQFLAVGRSPRPVLEATVPVDLSHHSGARIEVLEHRSDRWRVKVEGEGGVLILRRSYQPLLRARIGDDPLMTMPANFCLLGVLVPPGIHVVTVEASRRPQTVAGIISILTLGWVFFLGRRR
jgi:hypothetical protein